jgi:hypothetical protein
MSWLGSVPVYGRQVHGLFSCIVSSDSIAEFHTELELIPAEVRSALQLQP